MLVTIVDGTDQRGKVSGSEVAIRNGSPQSERTLQAKGAIIRNHSKEKKNISWFLEKCC